MAGMLSRRRFPWLLLALIAVPIAVASSSPASLAATGCAPKSSTYSKAILATPYVIGFWRLDETSGAVACDARALNNGTYSGSYALSQGGALVSDANTAVGLSGGGRASVPSSSSLTPTGPLSIEAWVRPNSATTSQTVVRKEGQYLLRISNRQLLFRLWKTDGTTVELASPQMLVGGAFQHVVATFDSSGMRIYRNGAMRASAPFTGSRRASSQTLSIGSSGSYDHFSGRIDEVAIYNESLSPTAVDAHWDLGNSAASEPDPDPDPDPEPTGCLPAYGSFAAGNWPSGCWRPFGASSPFNQPLDAGDKLHPSSGAIVSRMLSLYRGPSKLVAGDADTSADYSHPIYYSRSSDPLFTLHCYEASWGTCPIEGHKIRIPNAARAAGGGDGHMAVIDQASGWEYDLYKIRSKPSGGGTLEFRWGGRTRIDGDGLGSNATAAHFGLSAGVIRTQEMQAGKIDHALFMVVKCTSGRVYPAGASGSLCADKTNAPAAGMRFRLAYTAAEIDALSVPAWKKTILHALRTYGAYIGDTGGGGFNFQFESGSAYTSFGYGDRLLTWASSVGGTIKTDGNVVFDVASGVDWSRLRVVDPCVAARTC
jgi:Concanavalin A-like lectin/glucanases superfamily